MPCDDKQIEKKKKYLNTLYNEFNNHQSLIDMYGEAHSGNKLVRKLIGELFFDENEVNLNAYMPSGDKDNSDRASFKRVKHRIRDWNNFIKSGVSPVEANVNTLSDVARKNPVILRFSRKLQSTINYERKNMSSYQTDIADIQDDLKSIMLLNKKSGKSKYSFKKASKEIDRIQDAMSVALQTNDAETVSQLKMELDKVMGEEGSGNVLKAFSYMMNNMSIKDIENGDFNTNLFDKEVMDSVSTAAVKAKNLLESMGKINVQGLKKAKEVVTLIYGERDNYKAKSMMNAFDNAINNIEAGIKDGTYMPHYSIEQMTRLENLIDTIRIDEVQAGTYSERLLSDIKSSLSDVVSAGKTRSGRDNILYRENPINVLESYSSNAVNFNKKQHLVENYLNYLKEINPNNADWNHLSSVNEFIAQKLLASEGYTDASSFAKTIIPQLSKLQTVGKMGLSITGAIRNSTQLFMYVSYKGLRNYRKGNKLLNRDKTYNIGDTTENLRVIIDGLHKESGYFFDNMENISGGALMNMDGVDKRTMEIVNDEDGNPVISYKRRGKWETFDKKTAELTGKSLMFHQATENYVRKKVYDNSFALHFDKMVGNETMLRNYMRQNDISSKKVAVNRIITEANNVALKMVEFTQFEYGKFNRPELMGGGISNKSLYGNVAFQFMTYATNLFNYNKKVMKDGYRAVTDREFNDGRFGAAARLAGMQVMVGLLSVLFNNEFSYMIENDTLDRSKKLYDFMTSDKKEKINYEGGLVSLFTGPAIQDAIFYAEAAGLDWSENEIAELALGYYDFESKTKDEKVKSIMQRNAGFLNDILKVGETVKNGDMTSLIRNQLAMYPTKDTRERHKKFTEAIGLNGEETNNKKKKPSESEVEKALSVIRQLQGTN